MNSASKLFIAVLGAFVPAIGLADFNDLLKQVPPSANYLVLAEAGQIAESAKQSEGRQIQDFLNASKAWPMIAVWNPTRIVVASELVIQHMEPEWEMAAVALSSKPDLDQIAKSTNGVVDKLMGYDLIWLENACIMATGEKQLTIVSPLNRQSATRWLRRIGRTEKPDLSPYLASIAESAAGGDAEIVMAMDLENVFRPEEISAAVERSTLLKKVNTDPTLVLSSIRGLAFRVQIEENQKSSFEVDFNRPVDVLEPVAKPLMLNALAKAGAMLPGLNTWSARTENKQISLQGKMTPFGLGRLLSISSTRSVGEQSTVAASPEEPPAADENQSDYEKRRIARMTGFYFKTVNGVIDNVMKNQDQDSLEEAALWINNQARRIDRTSTRNVDPDMVEYGKYVSAAMKEIVYEFYKSDDTMRSRMDQSTPAVGQTKITAVPNRYRRYNYGGDVVYEYAPMISQELNIGSAARERRAIRGEEVGSANEKAISIMREIEEETTIIRDKMKQRYGDDFKVK